MALNLTRAVQLSVDIGAHVIAGIDAIARKPWGRPSMSWPGLITPELASRMKKSVGFRNIAVHNYEAIDWAIVHAIVTRHLTDFDDFARAVGRLMDI